MNETMGSPKVDEGSMNTLFLKYGISAISVPRNIIGVMADRSVPPFTGNDKDMGFRTPSICNRGCA